MKKQIVETDGPSCARPQGRGQRGRQRPVDMAGQPAERRDLARPGGLRHGLHPGGTEIPAMSFTSAVAGELVHKRAVEEVLVTDSDRLEDVFWVAGRFPSGHGLYGDRCDRDRHDFISLLEMVRQGPGALVAHRYLGVPLDYRFVLRDIELRLADGFSAMPRRDAGSDVVMTVTATDRV